MRQAQIIYTNLLELLNSITGHLGNDAFIAALNSPDDDKFVQILDNIQSEIDTIIISRDTEALYPNYNQLEVLIDEIETNFSSYNLDRYNEIKSIITISKIITDQITDLTDTVDYDIGLFDLLELQEPDSIPQKFYAYENVVTFEDSVILFTPTNYIDLDNNLRNSTITLSFLFIFLSKIGITGNILSADKYVLLRTGQAGLHKRINSFLVIHMISDGLVVHVPKSYANHPTNPWRNEITSTNRYQQFSDIFDVISEYNFNRDIINKYLKIYQVIEDYMYKSQLVKFEREKNGQIFSLRDFKRMNEHISEKEITALKEFISAVFELEVNPGVLPLLTFRNHFMIQWAALLGFYPSVNEINSVLTQFGVMEGDNPHTHGSVNTGNIVKFTAQVIYYIRNSIVHNKTTEFHLTYKTLTNDIFTLLEKFLIPNLELIIFNITVKPTSNIVWFQHPSINIWQDN